MEPVTTLDARFSSPGATAVPWEEARLRLEVAELYWLTTVRADGRPHITPLLAIWDDDALHFSTGDTEQKYRNLEHGRAVAVTTGTNSFADGLDLVVEGWAEPVTDEARLHALSDAWAAKYGEDWRFEVRDGAFHSEAGGRGPVFRIAPAKVLGFAKGEPFSQTRWRFEPR